MMRTNKKIIKKGDAIVKLFCRDVCVWAIDVIGFSGFMRELKGTFYYPRPALLVKLFIMCVTACLLFWWLPPHHHQRVARARGGSLFSVEIINKPPHTDIKPAACNNSKGILKTTTTTKEARL